MKNLTDNTIRREFHKLMTSQYRKPKITLENQNADQIRVLLDKPFTIIKEYIKLFFKEVKGFYPSNSEGNCKECSDKLVQILNGDLIWGWFATDRIIEEHELKVPTIYGYNTIAGINEEDERQISHWWVEIGNVIIDLTAEQFNKFLAKSSEKYLPIEVIPKNTPKAQRYFGKQRHKDGGMIEEDYDEDQFEKESEEEHENNSISY
jgi:hypothetical protein